MNLIAELKRRKVFRVGAAYLVVGWVLIQVAATIDTRVLARVLGIRTFGPHSIRTEIERLDHP